jgi:hypothetical protein
MSDNVDLSNITIINANCVNPKLSVKALNFSSTNLKFAKTVLFSNEEPVNLTDNIDFIKIPKIETVNQYNEFILRNLVDYIETDYCLVTQNDGFVINPHLWRNEFLDYDYIGAPWTKHGMLVWGRTNRIGNGGFSLRSKQLMKFIQGFKRIDYSTPEDVITSLVIEKHNFKYPDVELACKFSLECPLEDYPFNVHESFGFHGKIIYDNLLYLCPNVLNIKNS